MHLSVKADEVSRTSKSDLQLFVLQFHLQLARVKKNKTQTGLKSLTGLQPNH